MGIISQDNENAKKSCLAGLLYEQDYNLLQEKYREKIKCVYIDPPYNTDSAPIVYKNGYKDSSWLSLIADRLLLSKKLMVPEGINCITIDDVEFNNLSRLVEDIFSKDNILGSVVIKNNPSGRSTAKGFSIAHEYGIFAAKSENTTIGRLTHSENQLARYKFRDDIGPFEWVNFRKHGGANANRHARPKLYYPIFITSTSVRFPDLVWNAKNNVWELLEKPRENEKVIYPITPDGEEKTWKWGIDTAKSNPNEFTVRKDQTGELGVYRKGRLNENGTLPLTVWDKPEYSSTEHGTNLLKRIFGKSEKFSFPKSVFAVIDSLRVCNCNSSEIVLDYFAGSGTTGHAVINLNREDGGNRKYILVEMGNYFNTVTKPRIKKIIYAKDWKDGKPQNRNTGVSQIFKYVRLESYEDTLNNIELGRTPEQEQQLRMDANFFNEYLVSYMLDIESRGSLLSLDRFKEPFAYKMKIAENNETIETIIDLVETFNYLLGLTVTRQRAAARFNAVPDGKGEYENAVMLTEDREGKYIFKTVEGIMPNGDKALVIWRSLTGDLAADNAALDAFFVKYRAESWREELDLIYVNGDSNLENLRSEKEQWKVHLIELEFKKRMFEGV